MSSPEPISQRLLQAQPPQPSPAWLSLPDPSGSSTLPASACSCLKKPELKAKRGREPGRSRPGPHSKGAAWRSSISQQSQRCEQLELCHGTTAELSRAGSSRYGDTGNLGSLSTPQLLHGCVCTPKLGINRRASAWLFFQTCSLIRRVFPAEKTT